MLLPKRGIPPPFLQAHPLSTHSPASLISAALVLYDLFPFPVFFCFLVFFFFNSFAKLALAIQSAEPSENRVGMEQGMQEQNCLLWQLEAAGAVQLSCQIASLHDTLFQLH